MQYKEWMDTELMLNAYEIDYGGVERKLREHDRENIKSACVFHFKLSAPHFHDVGTTFDFDSWTAFERLRNVIHSYIMLARTAESLPLRKQINLVWFVYPCS